jgi:hypothetical protein
MRPAGETGNRPGDGGRDDDPAVARARQRGQARLNREDRALEVDPEHLIQIGLGQVLQPGVGEDSGVRAEDVDAAQPFLRDPRHPAAVFGTGHIGEHERDLPSDPADPADPGRRGLIAELIGRGPGDLEIPPGDQHLRPVAGEHARYSLADPPGAAGHDHGPARD